MSKKIIVAYYRNAYGIKFYRDFSCAEDYLDWRKETNPEYWNPRNELHLELIKVYTRWLPLDWRGLI